MPQKRAVTGAAGIYARIKSTIGAVPLRVRYDRFAVGAEEVVQEFFGADARAAEISSRVGGEL